MRSFSLRLAAVGLLGAVTLTPESALAFNGMALRTCLPGTAVHRAVSGLQPARGPRTVAVATKMEADAATEKAWSAAGMTVEDFYTNSIGSWRSLRSSHNIAFAQLEEVNSDIDITMVDQDDEELIQVCMRGPGYEHSRRKSAPETTKVSVRMVASCCGGRRQSDIEDGSVNM